MPPAPHWASQGAPASLVPTRMEIEAHPGWVLAHVTQQVERNGALGSPRRPGLPSFGCQQSALAYPHAACIRVAQAQAHGWWAVSCPHWMDRRGPPCASKVAQTPPTPPHTRMGPVRRGRWRTLQPPPPVDRRADQWADQWTGERPSRDSWQAVPAQMACAGKLQTQGQEAGPGGRVARHQADGRRQAHPLAVTAAHSHGAEVRRPPSWGPAAGWWLSSRCLGAPGRRLRSPLARQKSRAWAQAPTRRPAILRLSRACDPPRGLGRTDTWPALLQVLGWTSKESGRSGLGAGPLG